MLTLLCVLLTAALWCPPIALLVVIAAIILGNAVENRYGSLRIFGLAPMLDVLLGSPYLLCLLHSVADPRLTPSASSRLPGSTLALALSVAINAANAALIFRLLSPRPIAPGILPLNGLWARRLLASLALIAGFASAEPVVLATWPRPEIPEFAPAALPWLFIGVYACLAYLAPFWLVMVYGWEGLRPGSPGNSSTQRDTDWTGRTQN